MPLTEHSRPILQECDAPIGMGSGSRSAARSSRSASRSASRSSRSASKSVQNSLESLRLTLAKTRIAPPNTTSNLKQTLVELRAKLANNTRVRNAKKPPLAPIGRPRPLPNGPKEPVHYKPQSPPKLAPRWDLYNRLVKAGLLSVEDFRKLTPEEQEDYIVTMFKKVSNDYTLDFMFKYYNVKLNASGDGLILLP